MIMNETNATNIHTQTKTSKTWNHAEGRFTFSFVFAFQTREQYLDFRRHWKANYAALSKSLRDTKELIKATMRKREYAGNHQIRLHALKQDASVQLSMLQGAKQEANRQWLAARQAAT
jgi:hypothetical protein